MKECFQRSNIKKRVTEADDILKYYKELNLYDREGQRIPNEDKELLIESLLILTTADLIDVGCEFPSSKSAIHYYLNNKDKIDNLVYEDDWNCKVICVGDFKKNRRYPAKKYDLPSDWK